MDKLDVALELIKRAKQERKRLDSYEAELKKFYASGTCGWKERAKIELKYSPLPRKSVVNDSLRMARRMLAEEYI